MQLAEGLRKDGYSVKLTTGRTLEPYEDIESFSKRTDVPLILVDELKRSINPYWDLKALLRLRHIIGSEKPDIVHTHSSKAGFLGRLAARWAGATTIIHSPHGHVFYGYFGKLRTELYILLERLTTRITDRVITLTERGKWDHVSLKVGPSEKFETIFCGIDISKFKGAERDREWIETEFGIPRDSLLAGWVGRLVPIKGCEHFIRACNLAVKQRPDVRFLIVGDGTLRGELEDLMGSLRMEKRMVFAGDRQDVPDIMASLDLFVLSSLNEGLGRVLIEAMACGLPVVATDVGGVGDIVADGETGLLVPPADAIRMSEVMVKVLSDSRLRGRLGRAGEKRAGIFELGRTIERTEELYCRLMEKRLR